MADETHHCPFLNRTDPRCAEYFNLDHLQHAFKYCFNRYKACPQYLDRLVERRVRRSVNTESNVERSHGREPLVQVTIARRNSQRAAHAALVSAASGR